MEKLIVKHEKNNYAYSIQSALMEKLIVKYEKNDIAYSIQSVSFPAFDWGQTKKQMTDRRNFLDVQINF